MKLAMIVNGAAVERDISPDTTLVDFLRRELKLAGTKKGCGIGECGACTVILNGDAVNSCLVLAAQCQGAVVYTVESLEQDGVPDPLQRSFVEHHALQCGYCTAGMLMSAKALLMRNPNPSEEEILSAISGNLCRCTGYQTITRAIRQAGEAYQ
ncbi:(2Fe-2S)-binding protein [Colidextribacter sp. OB.20]|uniref:(2Fe-2S)-binding protein n=1 Tax=Colidextribacter sp. OB.20 TaxID=2304568 RepID=UPI001371C7AE|nr:(2Fe-2S)-binding protein [Colidextribacter sp. OB.20]NBI11253.1 (2Fe-2S)-binding protein [Colidextribacter sp. OB.20]